MPQQVRKAWLALVALGLFLGLSSGAQAAQVPLQEDSNYQDYAVFAFNDLGMHCYDSDFSVFSLLPPFNVIHAQVIQKGLKPQLLNDSAFSVTYAATYDLNGSINTTSIGKTNFWTYLPQLFGLTQPLDTGILGYKMPDDSFGPQALTPYDPTHNWFSATGIPLTNIDDVGKVNCFPMMRITATDKATSLPRSFLDIVVPTSSEMNCVSCHETAAFANYVTTFSDASPPPRIGPPPGADLLQDTSFSMNPDPNLRFRENILILHDSLGSYGGANTSYPGFIAAAYPGHDSLWEVYQTGQPILCSKCHYSKALDLAGTGPDALQANHLYLSRAMHKHHGTDWPMMDGTYVIPIPGAYTNPPSPSECYYCHPGNDTQCLRSVMSVHGVSCQSCHGDLLAVAGFTPQLAQDGFVDAYLPNVSDQPGLRINLTTTSTQRQPWQDMPKCQSCHSGDALSHLGTDLIGTQSYDPNDPAATPLIAANQRFAENPGQLYRNSQTHGGVACESCHGSPHAEWPARSASNDNITATQIQGHPGEISECTVCHLQTLPPGLGGPHGLHNVNDPGWLAQHGVFLLHDRNSCKACHGMDLHGTVLSRTKADRVLTLSKQMGGGPITIPLGTPVDCYACHNTVSLADVAPMLNLLLRD
jgi:hypothetical protein